MARPNIDIPQFLHGAAKDYADREELTVNEAYITILSEKLICEGVLPDYNISEIIALSARGDVDDLPEDTMIVNKDGKSGEEHQDEQADESIEEEQPRSETDESESDNTTDRN